jgi:hypothetical protein
VPPAVITHLIIGERKSAFLSIISKKETLKAFFFSTFSPEVAADDAENSRKKQLSLNKLVCARLKTKPNNYAYFRVAHGAPNFSFLW